MAMPFSDERRRRQGQPDNDEDGEFDDPTALFVPLRGRPAPAVDDFDDDEATASLPHITRMPDGFTVVEQQIGHATGQWVFVLLCDCGRRWFALHAVDTAQCPRCERWVRVETDSKIPG